MKATLTRLWNEAFIAVILQGVPSITESGSCVYRGEDGRKCAAAHLMTPSALRAVPENTPASIILRKFGKAAFGIEDAVVGSDYSLLGTFLDGLQRCHDEAGRAYPNTSDDFNQRFIEVFGGNMLDLAKQYDLAIKGA